MEKEIRIKVSKKHSLYGKFQGSLRQPLLIVVHGLAVSKELGLYEEAVHWFSKNGFATFRFDLYGWQKDARQLIDCTLQTHAADLDAVVRYFRRRGAKHIFVAGHSYGGPVILLSHEQKFDGAALWDSSYGLSFTKTKYGVSGGKYIAELKGYFMRWGINVIIGKKMADEANALKWDDLPKNFSIPVKIIVAGKGVLVRGGKQYYKAANEPKAFAIIKGATHCFDEEGAEEKLFHETVEWFSRWK